MENIVINLCKTDQLLTPDSSNFLAAWRASFGLATGSWEFKLKIIIFLHRSTRLTSSTLGLSWSSFCGTSL